MKQEMDPILVILEILKKLVKYTVAKLIDYCFEELMVAVGHGHMLTQVEDGEVEAEDAMPGSTEELGSVFINP